MNKTLVRVPKAYTKNEIDQEVEELRELVEALLEYLYDKSKDMSKIENNFEDMYEFLQRTQVTLEDLESFLQAKDNLERG